MRYLLILGIALCSTSHARSTGAEVQVEAALIQVADLGSDAKTNYSALDSSGFVVGVVLSEAKGKLLVLQRQSFGGYRLEAESSFFENNFGSRHYIEIVQTTGARRFSIQVNSHVDCGIQVETFRLAHTTGAWRVAGYDKSQPDSKTCDVNFRSREYSANLLTHRVNVVEYRTGKVVKRGSRVAKYAAPSLGSFNFSMFENEP